MIDYGVVSTEHLSTVMSMVIDDQGIYGGGSDHNWVFMELSDNFVRKSGSLICLNKRCHGIFLKTKTGLVSRVWLVTWLMTLMMLL